MIAITDTTHFDVETSFDALNKVPSASVINSSIQVAMFKTTQITTALKNLLVSISNSYYNVYGNFITVPFDPNYHYRLSALFRMVGFGKNPNNGIITFIAKPNNLAKITDYIIKDLVIFKSFRDRALHTWTQQANAIRSMQGLELERLNEIAVYNSKNENENKLLNNKPQNTGRFLEITTAPSMPVVNIFNYSATAIKVRVKIEFSKPNTGSQRRKFLDYFPAEINNTVQTHTIPVNNYWSVDFENKIRGGTVTIEYVKSSENWNNTNISKFIFYIRGTNPSLPQIKAYLNTTLYLDKYWFLLKLMKQESNLQQFNNKENNYLYNDLSRGLPTFGVPAGYGMGQVDNMGKGIKIPTNPEDPLYFLNRLKTGGDMEYQTITYQNVTYQVYTYQGKAYGMKAASDDAVWNWKKNIDEAIKVADQNAQGIITNAQKNDYKAIKKWNDDHPNDKVIIPDDITYEDTKTGVKIIYSWVKSSIPSLDIAELNALFTSGQGSTETKKSFFDARIIKTYNGLGGKAPKLHFIYILADDPDVKPLIKIYELAFRDGTLVNYVKDVSLQNV